MIDLREKIRSILIDPTDEDHIDRIILSASKFSDDIVHKEVVTVVLKGGAGSGNHGHKGIPGHQGGSLPQGSSASAVTASQINYDNVENLLKNNSFANFDKSSDKLNYVSDYGNKLSKSLGMSTSVKVISDADFNEKVKNVKISRDAAMLGGGASAITAGYSSVSNTVYLRDSMINSIHSANDYRLSMSALYHELGHAYHANVYGIVVQDKGEYGSGWCENFAETFDSKLGYSEMMLRLKTTPGAFPKLNARAMTYNVKDEFDQMLKDNKPTVNKEYRVVLKQLPITEKDKQKLLDLRINIFYNISDKLSEKVFSGELTIGAWEEKMRAELRQLHSSAAAIVKGGWDQMTSADWGRLGTPLREQYKYLHGFANTIAEQAETISLKAIQARARMYGRATGNTAALIQAGAVIEGMLPWMPADGSTKCLGSCKCRWELRITKVDKKSGDRTVKAVWRLSPAEHCTDCLERNGHVEMLVVPKDVIVPKYIGRGV
jgi:hypothetical protein